MADGDIATGRGRVLFREQADQSDKGGHETDDECTVEEGEMKLPRFGVRSEADLIDPAFMMRDVMELSHAYLKA